MSSGRILVLKTSSMGDVVHAMPAVTDMIAARPGLVIDWLVEKPFAAIPGLHPGIARVMPMAWRKWRRALFKRATWSAMGDLRHALREHRYELVLDLQGLTKSVMWGLQAHGPLVGYDRHSIRDPFATLFYQRKASVSWALQAVERNRRLAAAHLGYAMPATPPDFGLRAPQVSWMPSRDHAVLIPCASRPEKLWPEDRWVAIGRRCLELGWQPVLLWGSPAEEALAQRIATQCEGLVPPFLTVGETAAVLAGARQLVGLDTGFTHLGAAFGRPTVGIYCDHEPGQAGVTGSGPVTSLGGKGQVPALDAVLAAFESQRSAAPGPT